MGDEVYGTVGWSIPCPSEGDGEACKDCWASHQDSEPYCNSKEYRDKRERQKIIKPSFVKKLLGGKWPESKQFPGFGFECIDHFELEEDGSLCPYLGGAPMCGPSYQLVEVKELLNWRTKR